MDKVNFDEIELHVEELEAVIAPGLTTNHNETLVTELEVEELEAVVAPGLMPNHNETLLSEEIELAGEKRDEMIAPASSRTTTRFSRLTTNLSVEDLKELIARAASRTTTGRS